MTAQGIQHGDPPFGFRRDENRWLRQVSDEAGIVREMVQRIQGGESPSLIAASLNRRGFSTVRGRPWTRYSIHALLTNPTIGGLVHDHYRTTGRVVGPGKIEPIIDESSFWQLQEIFAARRRGGSPRPWGRPPLPLSGLAHSRAGGHPLVGAGRGLMRCRPNQQMHVGACPQPTAHAAVLEAQIGAYVGGMVVPSEMVEAIIDEARDQIAPEQADPATLQRQLRDLTRALKAGDIDFDLFHAEAQPVKDQLARLDASAMEFDLNRAIALVRDQGGQWNAMDRSERRTYVRSVFERVSVDGDQITEIQPKSEWTTLFTVDRDERFSGSRNMVGPAGFEPTTERL